MEPSWSIPIPQAMQQHGGLTRSKSAAKPLCAAADTQPNTEPTPETAPTREPDQHI
jgi:hypothetical protein